MKNLSLIFSRPRWPLMDPFPAPNGPAGSQDGILLGSLTWWSFQDRGGVSVTPRTPGKSEVLLPRD